MEIPQKTLKNGFTIPAFGLGTWQMGGRFDRNPDNDDAADVEAIKRAIEKGVTCIDTAESYAEGYAERLVAQATHGYPRENLFIISKASAHHHSREALLAACKDSLERLKMDYLDLYLLHRHNTEIPLEESMAAMDELVAEGLVRNIGVANFSVESLAQAQRYTKHPIVYNQVHYNLEYREPEHAGLLTYCQEHDVLLAAWRPVQKGSLLKDVPPVLQELSDKYQKTPAQIAINWLIFQRNVITLAKMGTAAHLEENLGALGWQMETEDIERLRQEYPDQKQVSDAVPLG